MPHGLGGLGNEQSPYMKWETCTKNILKKKYDYTTINTNRYHVCRCRIDGLFFFFLEYGANICTILFVHLINYLIKQYEAHIDLEWCNQEGSI